MATKVARVQRCSGNTSSKPTETSAVGSGIKPKVSACASGRPHNGEAKG